MMDHFNVIVPAGAISDGQLLEIVKQGVKKVYPNIEEIEVDFVETFDAEKE